jgi:biopolymer transport protein ExbD
MTRLYTLKRPQTIEEPQINLTALIDIVFVVLIIFILIAPLLELDRVQLAEAPKANTPLAVQEASPITLQVQRDNTIWVNTLPIRPELLRDKLKELKKLFPSARPQLFHDKKAEFGTYQSVKNALEEAGFSELDIVLTP